VFLVSLSLDTGGYCIYMGCNLIPWYAKKKNTVSHYSTEAEYRAIADITIEVIWLSALLNELGISQSQSRSPTLYMV
jgi:hypothetical protein